MIVTYCESVFVALGIQHAMRMHHIACGLPRSTTFFHFILYTTRFSKTVFEHKLCVSIFSTTFFSETFFILRRTERDVIRRVRVYWSSCTVPFILVRF